MKAATADRYGPPEVVQVRDMPEPTLRDDHILVDVHAFSVTTADWRMRASAFPGGLWLIGRLMTGLFRPRHPLSSREFSGRVTAVGARVERFKVGDDVFGIHNAGVSAERIAVPDRAVVLKKPDTLSHAEAAALPFGGLTAVVFARDLAHVEPGQRVLVTGASGGVGVYLVQIAKHLGAHVTAVARASNRDWLADLGADATIDYTVADPRDGGPYDVIFDAISLTTFAGYRQALTPTGRHAFIEARMLEMWQALVTPLRPGPKVVFGVAGESREGLQALVDLVVSGAIRPVIGHRFDLDDVVEAHRVVDGRRGKRGAVIVDVVPEQAARPVLAQVGSSAHAGTAHAV